MTLTDWIISASTGVIAILMALLAYFGQKWIESVEKAIEKLTDKFENVATQVDSLKQEKGSEATSVSEAIQAQFSGLKFPHSKIDSIEEEVKFVKKVVQEKLLPHAEKMTDGFGRIILLEKNQQDQHEKMITMFSALKVLAAQKQKDQK